MQLKKDLLRCFSVASCFLIPTIIFSNIGTTAINFNRVAEFIYPVISFHPEPTSKNSRIAILEIDAKTEKDFGWPLPRSVFAKTFRELQQNSGHPLVVSLLHFQEKTDSATNEDFELEESIAKYGKYLSSGIQVDEKNNSILSPRETNILQTKSLLTSTSSHVSNKYMMLKFDESARFAQHAIAIGLAPRFGTETIVYCTQMDYPEAVNQDGESIVSTVALAAALANQTNIATSHGLQKIWKQQRPSLNVSSKHCLSSPRIDTETYLKIRGIERISLSQYLTNPKSYDFSGKTVVLASGKMRLFQGPKGPLSQSQSGIVPEHLLTTRFIDDLVTNTSLRQEQQSYQTAVQLFCLTLLFALAGLSLYMSAGSLLLIAISATVTLIGISMVTTNILQEFYMPIDGILGFSLSSIMAGICLIFLRAIQATRKIKFDEKLRSELSFTQNMDQLFETAERLIGDEFSRVKIQHNGENLHLDAIVKNPKLFLSQSKTSPERRHSSRPNLKSHRFSHIKSKRNLFLIGRSLQYEVTFPCFDKDGWFGEVILQATCLFWERHGSIRLLKSACEEIANNWCRIELQALQKIKDFEVLHLHAKSEILGRFLTKNIVNRFSNHNFATDELSAILTPRRSKVAIMQADVRGYSTIFKDKDPIQVILWLKSFYEKVIDEASEYAQVKLVGDCIFLFIEEQHPLSYQALQQAYQIAIKLIETTVLNNEKSAHSGMPTVNFGIAINYGEVIVGNLSSDHCIDYTIVGSQANRTARLEELTKVPAVKDMVGENAILFSEEAAVPLQKVLKAQFQQLNLDEINSSVRSFPDTKIVWFVRAEEALNMDKKWLKVG